MNLNTTPFWLPQTNKRRFSYVLAVILIVLGWRLIVLASRARLQDIAEQAGAVKVIVKPPMPNNAGTHFIFAQSTDTGVGIYFSTLQQGGRELVYEIAENRILSGTLQLLGWAPDDSLFAFAHPIKGKKQEVSLCSGYVGKVVKKIEIDGIISEFAWLSPHSFAYINGNQELYIISRNGKGKWVPVQHAGQLGEAVIQNLISISEKTVAWKQGSKLWMLEIETKTPRLIWDFGADELVDISFSKDKNKFLICTMDKEGRYKLSTMQPYGASPIELGKINGNQIEKLKWIHSGRDYAVLCSGAGNKFIAFGSDGPDLRASPLFEGSVLDFTSVGDHIFLLGSTNQEPLSIWDYDTETKGLKCIVSSTDKPFTAANSLSHESGIITNGTREIVYHVWRPSRISRHKKYPLIIGQTPYAWSPFPYVGVGAGYYFVTINRKEWFTGLETWEDDVMKVLEQLKKSSNIDENSMLLYGRSAETEPISGILQKSPGLWKGAILFSPSELPELPCGQLSSMLIDAGKQDFAGIDRLLQFQTDAAARGLRTTLLIHNTARHTSWSTATQKVRVQHLAEFLSQN